MVFKELAIRIETQTRKIGGPRYTYIFNCSHSECKKEIRVRSDALKTHSGKCNVHSHVLRPFESIYNSLKNDHRNIEINLTYEEFLDFTKNNNCHYCDSKINRTEYGTIDGSYISRAYFLDRKDCSLGYSKDNCVTCCTSCNRLRSNKFTYDEFMLLSPILKSIINGRK